MPYNEPWYLQVVCPNYRTYTDGKVTFNYEINDRGEAASPYGYAGICGYLPAEQLDFSKNIRRSLGYPIFIRHSVGYVYQGSECHTSSRYTRVIPYQDPWQEGCAFLKEARRAERLGITAEVQGSDKAALLAFKAGYLKAMQDKHAHPKYHALVHRLGEWSGNERVCVVSTKNASSLFLIGNDGWAHYHLSYRGPVSHGTETYAIFSAVVPHLAAMGVERIHLGGGMSDKPNDPLLAFKMKVGRMPHRVYFESIP